MARSTITTDVDKAIDFLRYMFGDDPKGFIQLFKLKPGEAKPKEDEEGEPVVVKTKSPGLNDGYSAPEKINSDWWRQFSTLYNIWFCTALGKEKNKTHDTRNTLEVPAIWFDLDACKYFGVPVKPFLSDHRNDDDVSCWVQSSENALQGYYKLKVPYNLDGSAENFKKDLLELLCKICLYFGGDMGVVSPGRVMRLPGSLNLKPEYPIPFQVKAHYTDNVISMKELKAKFKGVNPDTVPRIVLFALEYIIRASEFWNVGSRHQIMLLLAGTVRKMGMNKEACLALFNELYQKLGDDEYREADVLSTYQEEDIKKLASLRSGFGEIADPVEKVIEFWVKLKKMYCKKLSIQFVPENYDPTKSVEENGAFIERVTETYFNGSDGPVAFSNFVIHVKGKLVKVPSGDIMWLAQVVTKGQPAQIVELSTASHNTWATFSKIPHLPTGLAVYNTKIWSHYVAWLNDNCPDETFYETPYYGWLDVEEDGAILLIQGQEHEKYIWTKGNTDTAIPGAYQKELGKTDIVRYLKNFAKNYDGYHEDRYIWSALGWFAAVPLSAFFRKKIGGYPAMVIYGLAGSGKTQLPIKLLSPHFGCTLPSSYDGSSPFYIRSHMLSNNLCPLVIDNFKENPGNNQTQKAQDLIGIISNSWDGNMVGAGKADGGVRIDRLQAPICVTAEHLYTEESTVHRTFSIYIDHKWTNYMKSVSEEERLEHDRKEAWLHSNRHAGYMSTIILNWVAENLEETLDIIDQCTLKLRKECAKSATVERKRDGFSGPLAGLYLLKRIYTYYGLEFPIKSSQFLPLIMAADPEAKKVSHGSSAMNELFRVTDTAISMNLRRRTPLIGSVYVINPNDKQYAYFDINRWRAEIKSYMTGTSSASLTNDRAFYSLLQDCLTSQEATPIVDFPKDHPVFKHMCVKIDLGIVATKFKVNTHQWQDIEAQYGE